jgi:hypothetical protein
MIEELNQLAGPGASGPGLQAAPASMGGGGRRAALLAVRTMTRRRFTDEARSEG